jgi:hypothetical protein
MLQNDVSLEHEAVIVVMVADNTPGCSGELLLEVHCEATVHMSAVRSTR